MFEHTSHSPESWNSHLNGLVDFARKSTTNACAANPSPERTQKLVEKVARFADSDILRVLTTTANVPEPKRSELQPKCSKGCDHCCYQWVRCSIPEALFTFEGIKSTCMPEEIADLRARIGVYAAELVPDESGVIPQVPCPLLRDGACSVYEHRPLICRGVGSLDADACLAAKLDPQNVTVPYLLPMLQITAALRNGLAQGIGAAGLPGYDVVLAFALRILIDDPDAAAKYFAGEDVFLPAKAESTNVLPL